MLSLLLAASLAFTSAESRLAFTTADRLVREHTPRDAGTDGARRAAEFLRAAAAETGAECRLDAFSAPTPKGERRFFNVIAEFADAPADPWVVFVSHFDTKPGSKCPGANDGAATSGLLVALARSLASVRPPHVNVQLLWTDGEECMEYYRDQDGFWGSRHAAVVWKASGRKVLGVVCLDMLGDRDLGMTIPRNGSPKLAQAVADAAAKSGATGVVRRSEMMVKDDHVPFLEAGFPAVDLIDFDYGSAPGINDYWHTPKDTMDKVSEKSLRTVGGILVNLLQRLAR